MDATIPRSFPVITGLPLSAGSRDCSQDAKKASASMCTMARGKPWMESGAFCIRALVPANNRSYDGRNCKLLFGNNRFERGIGGIENNLAVLAAEIFHGPLAVYLGNYYISVFRLAASLDKHLVAGKDSGVHHGAS